jgi:glutamyl-tRNA synthetase
MSPDAVVTRFAPSPTGQLHLGNARTALFNYLLARHTGGRFVLRVEDSDPARSQESFTRGLCEDLSWLGLSWDEGPGAGGPHGPYLQSQRAELYRGFYALLEDTGLAYPCYCTATELELANRAQRAAGRAPRYAGTCRQLSAAERGAREAAGRRASLRFRVPAGRRIDFDDLVHGPQSFLSDELGDFIIRREDGSASFLFANALDDALMQVTHVLRGEDHLSNTPRQRLLQDALSLPAPRYGHVSLLLGADGAPLSKRHGAASLADLREAGYAALAICNHLFRLGHFTPIHRLLPLAEMVEAFDVSHLQRASAHFDPAQLRHWQGEWVHSLSAEAALAWLAPLLPPALTGPQAAAFVTAVLPNVVLAEDVRQWREVIFGEALAFEEPALQAVRAAGAEFFAAAAHALEIGAVSGELALAALRQATGRQGAAFFKPLRAALTGRLHGPELAPLLTAMPAGRARERLLRFARAAA